MGIKRAVLWVAFVAVFASPVASAKRFGGFSPEGHYRHGDQVCAPVTRSTARPICSSGGEKLEFHKGQKQAGAHRKVRVRKKGTHLEFLSHPSGDTLFVWDSGRVLDSVNDVYLDRSSRWVAVEFSTRVAGRGVDDIVVIQLSGKPSPRGPTIDKASPSPPSSVRAPATSPATKADPNFVEAMKQGRKWAARKKHSKAVASFQRALQITPKQAEARYRLARSQFASGDKGVAVRTLQLLATDSSASGLKWKVEARFDSIFKPLRVDAAFRRAVGIEREPGDTISTYERLVGLGGRWEQEQRPCEQPQVNLELRRGEEPRFDLVIRSQCRGARERTRLDGSWQVGGAADLHLRFPNMGADEESLVCRLEICADASDEDCLRCQVEADLEFLLRIVRR